MLDNLPTFLKTPCDSIIGAVTRVNASNSYTHACSWKGRGWCVLKFCYHGIGIVAKPVINLVGGILGAVGGVCIFLPGVALYSLIKCNPCLLVRKTLWVASTVGGLLGNAAVSPFTEALNMFKAGAGIVHPAAYYRPLISDNDYLLTEAKRLEGGGLLTDVEYAGFKAFLEKVHAGNSDPRTELAFEEMQRSLSLLSDTWKDAINNEGNPLIEDAKRVEVIKNFVTGSAKCPAVWLDECSLNAVVLPTDPKKLLSYFIAEAKDEVIRNLVASNNLELELGAGAPEALQEPLKVYLMGVHGLMGIIGYGNTSTHEANIYRQMIHDLLGDVRVDTARKDPTLNVNMDAANSLGIKRLYVEKFLASFTEQFLVDYMSNKINSFEPGRKAWREKLLFGDQGLCPFDENFDNAVEIIKKAAVEKGFVLAEDLEGEKNCILTKEAILELLKEEIAQLKNAAEAVISLPQRKEAFRWLPLGGFVKSLEEFRSLYYIGI